MSKHTPKEANRKKTWAKTHPEARSKHNKTAYLNRKKKIDEYAVARAEKFAEGLKYALSQAELIAGENKAVSAHLEKAYSIILLCARKAYKKPVSNSAEAAQAENLPVSNSDRAAQAETPDSYPKDGTLLDKMHWTDKFDPYPQHAPLEIQQAWNRKYVEIAYNRLLIQQRTEELLKGNA